MQNSSDFLIRNTLEPGDLGQVAALHGKVYAEEYDFGLGFEAYVMESLLEFYRAYDKKKDRVWVVEREGSMIGFVLLMHRPSNRAQLRYFILAKEFRGFGIGSRLMKEWMEFYNDSNYDAAYLYTTSGLDAAVSLYERMGFRKISEMKSMNFGVLMLEQYYELITDPKK
ncbi:GNAT family N-acetyltransferase [Algoriphagus persicinus]|uniref:GNAT family N-acetyltransferase n=1 Tax=Algoriphagus persicinus TaxID=3108754 RepID=UPI002B3EAE86|nr:MULTISPECIES: GNAT family N-acetyltransferase [unclassified Algoriphagus]MEB2780830.1 GNAT family N-acetyltransferase [Algoriphagus sp. C2-6-M1]MEB2786256.1 GNAT family N-acetyltransferase [Algoriphagus sp. E1-3-M2]